MAPKPSERLYRMGDEYREQQARDAQTPKDKIRILTSFLMDRNNGLQDTQHNREVLAKAVGAEFYSYAALGEAAQANRNKLEHRSKVTRPLGREVTAAELEDWFKQNAAASPWLAITARNVDIVTKVFLNDERIPLTHNLQDLVKAVEIADREHRLDKNVPPKPKFEDSIEPWQLPMPSPDYVLRKADKRQLQDYIARAKRYEKWLKEQQD